MTSDLLLVLGALVAGVLTTLAPCVLSLLPVVVSGSLGGTRRLSGRPRRCRAHANSTEAGLHVLQSARRLPRQRAVRRLRWAADPHSRFRRGLGLLLVLVGVLVLTGADKDLQSWVVEHAPWRPWELDRGFLPES